MWKTAQTATSLTWRPVADSKTAARYNAKTIHAKKLDPLSKVSGRIRAANLRDGLNQLIAPLVLEATVRGEVILVKSKSQ